MTNPRPKGKQGELDVATRLRRLLHDDTIRRNLEQSATGGRDLIGDTIEHLAIEVKRTEIVRLPQWMDTLQVQNPHRRPVVIHRASRDPWRCWFRMTLEEFATMIETGRFP